MGIVLLEIRKQAERARRKKREDLKIKYVVYFREVTEVS